MRWRTALAAVTLAAIVGLLGSGLAMHIIAVADGLIMPAPFAAPSLVVVAMFVQTAVGGGQLRKAVRADPRSTVAASWRRRP